MVHIAIFVSGNGTNCERIIQYFSNNENIDISLVLSNKIDAYALIRAKKYNIPTEVISKKELYSTEIMLPLMKKYNVNFIVLAGFLLMIPDFLIKTYKNKIINIHPSLLPKFGGKGMYGYHVHKAVKEAKEGETGITIHYVTPVCDGGEIIEQHKTELKPNDTIENIANKIHILEQKFFPKAIEKTINKQFYNTKQ